MHWSVIFLNISNVTVCFYWFEIYSFYARNSFISFSLWWIVRLLVVNINTTNKFVSSNFECLRSTEISTVLFTLLCQVDFCLSLYCSITKEPSFVKSTHFYYEIWKKLFSFGLNNTQHLIDCSSIDCLFSAHQLF